MVEELAGSAFFDRLQNARNLAHRQHRVSTDEACSGHLARICEVLRTHSRRCVAEPGLNDQASSTSDRCSGLKPVLVSVNRLRAEQSATTTKMRRLGNSWRRLATWNRVKIQSRERLFQHDTLSFRRPKPP